MVWFETPLSIAPKPVAIVPLANAPVVVICALPVHSSRPSGETARVASEPVLVSAPVAISIAPCAVNVAAGMDAGATTPAEVVSGVENSTLAPSVKT